MNVGNLNPDTFAQTLASTGITVRCGPFVTRIISELPELTAPIQLLYSEFPIIEDSLVDFHVRVKAKSGLSHRLRSHITFTLDREEAFFPFHRSLALPLFEWGMNWCVYGNAHQFEMIHGAAVQRGKQTLMMPGVSGAGKSTLCAALVSRGWRLLSDELAIWRPGEDVILPLARPISLKNYSIELMKSFAPNETFGPYFGNTAKGALAHMRAPRESVRKMDEPSAPTHIIFPRYTAGSGPELEAVSKRDAFVRLSEYALNYPVHGKEGFNSLVDMIEKCDCYDFRYSILDDAIRAFDELS